MKLNSAFRAIGLAIMLFFYSSSAKSQCEEGATPLTVTYDSTVYGGGNDYYTFSCPQFDPNLGTLIAVQLQTNVTLEYSFQLENHNLSPSKHTLRITRIDELAYPGGVVDKTNFTNLGPYLLDGTNNILGSGPDFIQAGPLFPFRNLRNTYNLTSGIAGFLGNGVASIDYSTNSLANSVSNINSTLRGNASDTVVFTITYQYCKTAFLPAEISQFSANRSGTDKVDLRWNAPNDQAGTKYEIEKSADGKKFSRFESIVSTSNSSSNYQAKYALSEEDNKRLFFRIKEIGKDSEVKYSQVRTVSIPNNKAGEMRIYPTVSRGAFNIDFQEGTREDYLVSVYGMTGNLAQQERFTRTNFVRYSIKSPLKPGIYLVIAENIKTKELQKSKIIIQ